MSSPNTLIAATLACLAALVPRGFAAETAPKPGKPRIPACQFTYRMEWKGETIKDLGYWNWSFFAVAGDDGKYHGFGERAKESDLPFRTGACKVQNAAQRVRDIASAHTSFCEIGHYLADRPEGPYRFKEVALPRGGGRVTNAPGFTIVYNGMATAGS
ncbi:MAG: hypothetical protein NT154_20160 [Verrucomicrobia bacterium]|nr:hypothetical protein [Verrucomicrobiota bacterium]